ncbi:hypothetical protein EIZ47_01660 [Chryseobacterium lacus]|uniref:Lipopolysaccharide core biosynthesis protein rfaS n=1 Tax=Chryseobacterium lacus TaxID=2058346 RepID=A0A368N5U3_9FLAO|nr:hypothetical protein [Chryseobacterium lacus]RCU44944.1 hypothetical protein DQ356_01680 [Chryseobacterium lacus]RST32615.1 hypothetical protein EIZ47_01660 [Chryseobacterium lacus]
MKKKILFIAPDYFGFNEVIFEGLKKYSNYEVKHVVSAYTKRYKYRHFGEKLQNFFMKLFLNRNLKDEKQQMDFFRVLEKKDRYEQIIINRPDVISIENLQKLKNKTSIMKAIFWDSINKIKGQEETIQYFDQCFSFDSLDCIKYGFSKNHNFYFCDRSADTEPLYDVLFWGTEDGRIYNLIKILDFLNANSLHAHSILYRHLAKNIETHGKSQHITSTYELIPFSESYKVSSRTKIILDIAHQNQTGLSFRPFEAMGLRKKLITTNEMIKNYDFYDPQNILVIDPDNPHLDSDFLNTPYRELPEHILYKYSLESWIKNIIKNNNG